MAAGTRADAPVFSASSQERNAARACAKVKTSIARLEAREADRRKDRCVKTSTDLAHRFDVIRVEDLRIANMVKSARGSADAPGVNVAQKAGRNREIGRSGWGLLVRRLEDKAPDGSTGRPVNGELQPALLAW